MATKLYLPSSGTAPLASLAYDSNWELSDSAARRPSSTSKANTALTDITLTWSSATTQQWIWRQYQTAPMTAAYSWTTSDTVSMVIRCIEGNAQCDSHLAYSVRVVSSDGGTVRGTVGLYHATSTEFPTTTPATRIHSARTNGATNFSSSIGDRIVIEIGLHGVTPSTSYSQTMRNGDPSATGDFALTADLTTDLCPWVELSRTVTFGDVKGSIAGVIQALSQNNSLALKGKGYLIGVAGVPSTVSGTAYLIGHILGVSNGVSQNNSATLHLHTNIYGVTNGVSENNSATLHGHVPLLGITNGISENNSGVLVGKGSLAGVTGEPSTVTGTAALHGHLFGTTTGESSGSGILTGKGALIGLTDAFAAIYSVFGAKGTLSGSVQAESINNTGILKGQGTLSGSVTGESVGNSGTMAGRGTLIGSSPGVPSTVTGDLRAQSSNALDGHVYAESTVSGTLHGHGVLTGETDAVALVGGTLGGKADLQ